MNNSGKITVFISLITGVLAILAITVIQAIEIYSARSKAAMCGRITASCIRAEYNSYIYENYHILLFDRTAQGRGEAYREEQLMTVLQNNLGESFSVEDVAVTYNCITDNECSELRKQIHDYMPYAVVEYGVDKILHSTDGRDGSLDSDTEENLREVLEEVPEEEANETNYRQQRERQLNNSSAKPMIGTAYMYEPAQYISLSEYDPRDFTKNKTDLGLLALVLPEGENPSTTFIDLDGVPSEEYFPMFGAMVKNVDTSFEDMNDFADDIRTHACWMENLIDAGEGVVYARSVFNCLTDQEINPNTVFKYELEYLIAGKISDRNNLTKVIREIIEIRLPVNYAYLITDSSRMAEVMKISAPLAKLSRLPEKVIRYLIAGCWSYIEAVAEVRCLLHGSRLDFFKNSDNWITDIYDIRESIWGANQDDEKGLCYQDYLMILMSSRMDIVYYRMLDLMELNARKEEASFRMKNAATVFDANFIIKYGDYDCSCQLKAGY